MLHTTWELQFSCVYIGKGGKCVDEKWEIGKSEKLCHGICLAMGFSLTVVLCECI